MTVRERITAMAIEEMADFIITITRGCNYCQYHTDDGCPKLYTVDWINKEVDE